MIIKIQEITPEIESIIKALPNLELFLEVSSIRGLDTLIMRYIPNMGEDYDLDGESIDISKNTNGTWSVIRDNQPLGSPIPVVSNLLEGVKLVAKLWPKEELKETSN